jgi:UDP-glucose 4-epimerase
MENKTALITGGSGYLGSHLAKKLYKENWKVLILDQIQPKHNYYHDLYIGDIRDSKFLKDVFLNHAIDTVFHLAGRIEVGLSELEPTEFWSVNVGGTVLLLNIMNQFRVDKIVFSSTAAVYRESNNPISELDVVTDNSVYGSTKQVCEKAIRDSGINYFIFRYFNLSGADPEGDVGESHDPETHLIPMIFKKLNNFTIYGKDYNTIDGTCVRDYVHVCDVVDAHLNAVSYLDSGEPSKIVNLGSGQGYSILQVIQTFEDLYSTKVNCHFGSRRIGDPDSLVADISQAKKLLNYSPKHNLKSIIKTAYEWHKKLNNDQ